MRKMYGQYKEYHTSLDDKKLINFERIIETIKVYYEIFQTIETNFLPLGKVQYGTPQLSKSKINLYRDIMDYQTKNKGEKTSTILQILNLADGTKNLLEIANLKNFKLIDHAQSVKDLIKAGYLKINGHK